MSWHIYHTHLVGSHLQVRTYSRNKGYRSTLCSCIQYRYTYTISAPSTFEILQKYAHSLTKLFLILRLVLFPVIPMYVHELLEPPVTKITKQLITRLTMYIGEIIANNKAADSHLSLTVED